MKSPTGQLHFAAEVVEDWNRADQLNPVGRQKMGCPLRLRCRQVNYAGASIHEATARREHRFTRAPQRKGCSVPSFHFGNDLTAPQTGRPDRIHNHWPQDPLHAKTPRFLPRYEYMPRIRITDEYALIQRKGSTCWYLEWRERGEKRRRSTGTHCTDAARARAREIILESCVIRDADPADVPIGVVLDRYMTQHGAKLASSISAKRSVDLWKEFWEDAAVKELTPDRIEDFTVWLNARMCESTTRRVLGVGKAALNRARRRQEIESVPFIQLPQEGEAFEHTATLDQLAAFLNVIPEDSHVLTYCVIRLATACRDDAARELRPEQVDFDNGFIRLNPPGRKQTKKYRPIVPIPDLLYPYLQQRPDNGPYVNWHGASIKSIKTTWRKLRKAAGLPDWFVPRVLRHTVATELRKRGVPGWEVSGQLGHRGGESHRTTERYAKYDPDYLSQVRLALDAWLAELAAKVPRLRRVNPGSVRGQC
jgi:integrase